MKRAFRTLSAIAFAALWLVTAAIAQDNNPLASIRPGPSVPGGLPGVAPAKPAAPAAAGPDKSDDAAPSASGVPSLEDLSATRERPLFSSTRRPPDVEPTEQAAAAPITDASSMPFELVGIVAGSDVNAAIFRNTDTKEESRVAKGDTIGNWSVEDIAGRAVVLRSPDKRVRMRLFNESAAPGIQVGKASGGDEPAAEPAAEDQEQVDEDIAPASSPQIKPATAQPKPPPSLAQGRNQRNNPNNRRRPKRPSQGAQRNQEEP